MSLTTAEEIYEQVIKPLPVVERLRLSAASAESRASHHDWLSVRGIAPNLLNGEDAQAWVSRTRREADEQRELYRDTFLQPSL